MRKWAFVLIAAVVAGLNCAASEAVLAVCGAKPPEAFLAAAKSAGFTPVYNQNSIPNDADVACIVTPFPAGVAGELKPVAAAVKQMLSEGKLVIVALGEKANQAAALEPLLPVNLWTAGAPRSGCGLAVADPDFCKGLNFSSAALGSRIDVHLPYAPIEAGEHRYHWSTYGKDILNTDWKVLLRMDGPGALPVLIQSRLGPGTVITFASDLYGPKLIDWKDYSAFVRAILKIPNAPGPAASMIPKDLSIRIPRYQPDGLHVEIRNNAAVDEDVLLAYKIRNSEHSLLNSATQLLHVPAGKAERIGLQERSREFGELAIQMCGDDLPFRYVDVACASSDRRNIVSESERLVDLCPALTLDISGEDIRTIPELRQWPERVIGAGYDIAGGSPIPRYVYFKGAVPTLEISLRNGLHNIAPLAIPSDLNWKENPTVQGLNDLAFSDGGLRGYLPLFGAWSGKSAAEQRVALTWDEPVWLAGHSIVGNTGYRVWDRSNPRNYELLDQNGTVLTHNEKAEYHAASHQQSFTPVLTHSCQLHIKGLSPAANLEPRLLNDLPEYKTTAANCSIVEWETLGWPDEKPAADAEGRFVVALTELSTGNKTELLNTNVALKGLSERKFPIALPPCNAAGPLRVDAVFSGAGTAPIRKSFDLMIVERNHKAIEQVPESQMGLLCSPGFVALDGFGTGTQADVYGWGGPDDKIWTVTHDMMEQTTRYDQTANHFFTTAARFCHYTCPWREFPSGEYFWDVAADELEEMVQKKNFKCKTPGEFNIFLSDRWNGIPIGATMCWADFIRFDEYLRNSGGKGLKSRGRIALGEEIIKEHGDAYQTWQMNRYADKLLDVQKRLAKCGLIFTVSTHGSFPLAGGEIGAKLGKTHIASGTDLFWDLKNEDLYHTLGLRFGLIAANPDFESGAYNEWGWCSAAMNNPHWFAYTGTVEPARRQWYSTYFMGRITSAGVFEPLTRYGFHAQGGFGVKNTTRDWQEFYRTQEFTTRVRPEQPCGVGLVVSWHTQERHMSPHSPNMGFGLMAGAGFEQIDAMAGAVYERLAESGVPIEFVASTDTLKNWNGTQPLIVVDGYDLDDWEYDELKRLNRAGAPIIAIGAGERVQPKAADLFGVRKSDQGWAAVPDVKAITNDGHALAWIKGAGPAPLLFCPLEPRALNSRDTTALSKCIIDALGSPIVSPPGVVCVPFVSQDRLFVALNDLGDLSRNLEIAIRPALLDSNYTGQQFRIIDLDRGDVLASKWDDGQVKFHVPTAGSEGRMMLIVKD